jgi:uncharacterized protein (DUF2235 family)
MSKHIVYCADGTWNSPEQDKNHDQSIDPTNVYKLYACLQGARTSDASLIDEQEKQWVVDGAIRLIAKYIHGVGDSSNAIKKVIGGTFGAGVISRVVRGYTFISRNYEPGDLIHITGFSRGAYTARALAGLIASQGLLAKPLTADRETAYEKGGEAWYRYRESALPRLSLEHLAEVMANLPAFWKRKSLKAEDRVAVDRIATVAVWDTVGAMGFPKFGDDLRRTDAYKFADTQLSKKVGKGLHAIALDEQRVDFAPTLWDAADNVTQVLFPGAHSDVGGGYPMDGNGIERQSGLSDGALQWMMGRLTEAGVSFVDTPPAPIAINPDPAGTAHKPWTHPPFNVPTIFVGKRSFPKGMPMDPSIAQRMAAGDVIAEPGEAAAPYRPGNLT